MKKLSFVLIAAALFTSCTTEDVAPNYSGSYVAPKMCLTSNFEVTVEQIEGTEHKIFGIYTVDIVNGSFEGSMNNGITHSGTFSDDGKNLIYTQTLNGTSCVGSCVKQ